MSMPGGKQPAERTRDRLSLLRNHPLFQDLPSPVIEHLGSYMKTRKVARGATIFAKGDPGTGLMGVLTGSVKVSVASAEGKDIVLNIFREGEIFGEIALLDGRPRTADATAMSDCELIVIERRDFVPFLSSHPSKERLGYPTTALPRAQRLPRTSRRGRRYRSHLLRS